ncbi:hypothetical protein TanjilG_14581 [Lupinus angustifolius]|uniref:30S ribosomal protein S21 n=1 Tax=Lupinus angustifolius TaxID=3871 RepID=A0A1J7H9G6_LUPAN|nr:PREDICTED: uncharacterized protein LOC109350661 [Lupinus angustifolius]OIW09430.1 hypothetical protein TanjilG_14581 [Lupinus angustifolius]
MATSSFSTNFLSTILPTKPPSQFNLSSPSFIPIPSHNKLNIVPPLVSKHDNYSVSSDLSSVICPSLGHVNTLFYQSGYNVQVVVDDNESEERLLNRFRREVMKAGVIQETKRRRYFENKQEEKKRKHREAAKRNSRARRFSRFRPPMQNKPDIPEAKKVEDDDNWDIPEGTL